MLIFPSRTGRPKRIKNEPARKRRLVGTLDKYSVIVNSSVATPDGWDGRILLSVLLVEKNDRFGILFSCQG